MRRTLSIIATAISLLLLCAVTVLWVRSYSVCDMISCSSGKSFMSVHLVRGRVYFQTYPDKPLKTFPDDWGHHSSSAASFIDAVSPGAGVLGFDQAVINMGFMGSTWRERWTVVPYYALLVLSAILPAWTALRWRYLRKRVRRGLCPACGYDLRASPEHCPECGTLAMPTKAASA